MKTNRKPLNITDLKQNISIMYENDLYSYSDLHDIVSLCADYMNLISPKDLAKRDGISRDSANKETKTRKIVKVFNTKFISEKL